MLAYVARCCKSLTSKVLKEITFGQSSAVLHVNGCPSKLTFSFFYVAVPHLLNVSNQGLTCQDAKYLRRLCSDDSDIYGLIQVYKLKPELLNLLKPGVSK